jgi:hypothetical protein
MRDYLARKFKDRQAGYALAAVLPCSLPVRVFQLKVLLSEKVTYPLGGEFVLRAVALGLPTSHEIAGFLGLEDSLVAEFIADEIQAGDIAYNDQDKLSLTSRGKEAMANLAQFRLRPSTLDVQVDQASGLLASYLRLVKSPADIASLNRGDIGPDESILFLEPPRQPRPTRDFFNIHELNAFQVDDSTNVAEIQGLVKGKRFEEKFKLCWLLAFAEMGTDNLTFELVIDGEISESHQQFVNSEDFTANHDIEIDRPVEAPAIVEFLREFNLEEVSGSKIVEIYRDLEYLEEVADTPALEHKQMVTPANVPKQQFGVGKFLVEGEVPCRISVFEHPQILNEALSLAKNRLFIVSPWIKIGVVNIGFIERLKSLLKRDVQVTIVYGYEDGAGNTLKSLEMLLDLKQSGLKFLRHQNTHAKILLVDNTAVMTSFNWLSFMGDTNRTYRMEEGMEIRSKDFCDKLYADLNHQMAIEAKDADSSILNF